MTSPDQPDHADPADPERPAGPGQSTGPDDPAPDAPAADAPDFVRIPPAPRFTVERPVHSLYLSYSDPAPGEAPTMAHELLDETQGIDELLQDVAQDVTAVARRVSVATDRRRAARFAPAVLLAREVLDSMLQDLAQIDDCIDGLRAALGPATEDEHPHITEARIALRTARGIVQTSGETGREFARIGALATERVSDFAEAEMLHEQIVRDLRRGDLAAVDALMPRLVEVERVLVARGVTAKLAEVWRRREELAAGGRGGQSGWELPGRDDNDDYTI